MTFGALTLAPAHRQTLLTRMPSLTYVALVAAAVAACNNSTGPALQNLVPGAVELAPRDTSIPQAATVTLHVTVLDTAGNAISLRPLFTWTDSGLVTVSPQGVVRSLGPTGTVTIAATLGVLTDRVTVSIFDSSLAGHARLGGRPYGAAVSPSGVAYITQLDLGLLGRADLPARSFASAVAVGNTPTEVAFNATGTKAYVTNQFSQNVGVIDVASNTETSTVPVSGNPFAVIVAPGDNIVYVTTTADSLFGIRAATGEIATRLYLPIISNGFAIRDSLLYVSTRDVGTVTEINMKTNTVLRTLPVGGGPQGIVISPNGTELYVANETGDLQFWSLTTNASVGDVILAGRGFGLALRPSDGNLYVTTLEAGEVQVVNPTSRVLVKSITVGGKARRIAFNSSGSIGVVANEGGWVDFLK